MRDQPWRASAPVASPGSTHLAVDRHRLPAKCSEFVPVYTSKHLALRRLTLYDSVTPQYRSRPLNCKSGASLLSFCPQGMFTAGGLGRSEEEHTSELQSLRHLV